MGEMSLVERYKELRKQEISPTQTWARLKEEYVAQFRKQTTSGDAIESWKVKSGKAFEDIVLQEFTTQCKGLKNLHVVQWRAISASLKEPLSERLWVRGEIQSVTAESNVDVVAYESNSSNVPQRIIAVYSCKVSLRERFQQDLFWAERLRGRGVKFCFITLDNDNVLTKAATTGDLSSKQASMSVAVYDRIYLFRNESEIQHYSRVFRTVDRLGEDLKRWLELD
jgi:hypothetical protein